MEKFDPYIALLGRLFLSLIFILGGFSKLFGDAAATMAVMEAAGVPGFLFWPAALFEAIGGLLILAGYQTRILAFLMAGFCLVTAVMFHSNFAEQIEMVLFLKNLSMAGGFLVLMRFGAGEFSIDGRATAAAGA